MQVINTDNAPDKNLITVELRSHINPTLKVDGFSLGKKTKLKLPYNICLGEFLKMYFSDNRDAIGLIAINGINVESKRVLLEGDFIDIFSLISGG
ncbi:hypothetical protein SPSIL_036910 [Sporomusa silvacetica DSM 10669]|uniref:ThiS family protein n=1 Tax=Sporomusa silvacetica DSM 10669 TaxID=1123289 RepID=A0ABZ3IP88_9FIRM|nr:hypothetical protein [Sporomusa silvacetica]OZC19874.1 hypothetical protein SPSIL_17970 [Sporomusa silvacetica DSM 10669]